MTRILSLTMALLLAGSAAADDVPKSPPRRTVRFARVSSADRLRALLQAEIDRFTDLRLQFVTFVHDADADFGYSNLRIESNVDSRLRLLADVKDPSGTPHKVNSAWSADGSGSVRRLFDELLEKTLFDDERGAYRPLRIESCSMAGTRVRLGVARDASNALLDALVLYRLGVSDDGKHFTPVCIDLTVVDTDASAPETAATFDVDGAVIPANNFRASCRQQRCSGYLVPRLEPCLVRGTTNANASSLSAP